MRVAFILWGNRVFSPGMRASLDLAAALGALGSKASAVLVQSSEEVAREARRRLGDAEVRSCGDLSEVPEAVRALGPDVVYSKDHVDSLQVLSEIRSENRAKAVTFTSGFYHLEMLQGRSGLSRYLAYPWITRRYQRLLRSMDGVVAISYYCEMLLELLYGIRPLGVVYPSIDSTLYRPPAPPGERSGVLVFVGPEGNRPLSSFLPVLEGLPAAAGPVHLFGDVDATQHLYQRLGKARSRRHVDLTEAELVKLYGRVRATYITSEWEGFGLVGPESLLCGTPVVAEVAQPWMEITGESDAVRIGRSMKELVGFLTGAPRESPSLPLLRQHLSEALSPQVCAVRFERALSML